MLGNRNDRGRVVCWMDVFGTAPRRRVSFVVVVTYQVGTNEHVQWVPNFTLSSSASLSLTRTVSARSLFRCLTYIFDGVPTRKVTG